MMSTRQKRIKFIQSAIKLLRIYRFDGINIHWRNHGDPECQQEKEKLSFTLLTKVGFSFFSTKYFECHVITAMKQIYHNQFLLSFNNGYVVQELKEAFEAEETDCDRLIVTATVSPGRKTVNASYEVQAIAK